MGTKQTFITVPFKLSSFRQLYSFHGLLIGKEVKDMSSMNDKTFKFKIASKSYSQNLLELVKAMKLVEAHNNSLNPTEKYNKAHQNCLNGNEKEPFLFLKVPFQSNLHNLKKNLNRMRLI